MCGIAGIALREPSGVEPSDLARMAAALRHRGPDGWGLYCDDQVGLAHTRLSIIDIAGGAQPLTNEDGTVIVSYNGEIYNYIELRRELVALGHRFRTASDTEVVVHAYEAWNAGMLERFNGQFAFAIYDRKQRVLFLARDRFGVRPLHFAVRRDGLYFGSEIKAVFAAVKAPVGLDLVGLDQVFTSWAARAPRTCFEGVESVPPGTFARWHDGQISLHTYWRPELAARADAPPSALQDLDALLRSTVALRLRADVPVGGYLSGGLDSSIVCTLSAGQSPSRLRTFSIAFEDAALDESAFQYSVASSIDSHHVVRTITAADIAAAFPAVITHAETPLVRSAPAPMYLLAQLARDQGVKVVLTGEGADEVFLGYDLFKEVVVRRFCLRQPTSRIRPRLFDRLYPYLPHHGRGGEFWQRSFLDAGSPDDPLFSHMPRFGVTSRIRDFYSSAVQEHLHDSEPLNALRRDLPPDFDRMSDLSRAAWLEITTLLSAYLLSAQGDRMSMAFGVEARHPFLDHRLFEFAAKLPERSLLDGLKDKAILRRWAAGILEPSIAKRPKQPYRAPETPATFCGRDDMAADVLSASAVADAGVFDSRAVAALVRRARSGATTGTRETQAFVAVLSTQLWHRIFIRDARRPAPLKHPDVFLDSRSHSHSIASSLLPLAPVRHAPILV